MWFRQCGLQKALTNGIVRETAWIPEAFATLNRVVKLRDEHKNWEDGWKVVQIGTRQTHLYVVAHERDYRNQRVASDI